MAITKVLVLQGPLRASGINPVTQNLSKDIEARRVLSVPFDASHTIHALCYVFRVQGFKIIYSGWNDDAEWLNANRSLFDHLVLSDQSTLKTQDVRGDLVLPNSKQKLYYGALRGLELACEHYGKEALTLRLRSDVSVNFNHVLAEFRKLLSYPKSVLIEYMHMDKPHSMPDFMNIGHSASLLAVYRHLFELSAAGQSYHVSSHVDHSLAYMRLQELGVISDLICMERALFDSVVWRGVPRYMESVFHEHAEDMFFGGRVERNPAVSVADIVARIPPELSGRDPA